MNKFKTRTKTALVSAIYLFSVSVLTASCTPSANAMKKSDGSIDWAASFAGYDDRGYNIRGYDAQGYDRQGYNNHGYDKQGYDRRGNYNENEVYKPSTCTLL